MGRSNNKMQEINSRDLFKEITRIRETIRMLTIIVTTKLVAGGPLADVQDLEEITTVVETSNRLRTITTITIVASNRTSNRLSKSKSSKPNLSLSWKSRLQMSLSPLQQVYLTLVPLNCPLRLSFAPFR